MQEPKLAEGKKLKCCVQIVRFWFTLWNYPGCMVSICVSMLSHYTQIFTYYNNFKLSLRMYSRFPWCTTNNEIHKNLNMIIIKRSEIPIRITHKTSQSSKLSSLPAVESHESDTIEIMYDPGTWQNLVTAHKRRYPHWEIHSFGQQSQ